MSKVSETFPLTSEKLALNNDELNKMGVEIKNAHGSKM